MVLIFSKRIIMLIKKIFMSHMTTVLDRIKTNLSFLVLVMVNNVGLVQEYILLYNFMIPGHTKFICDAEFGSIKKGGIHFTDNHFTDVLFYRQSFYRKFILPKVHFT